MSVGVTWKLVGILFDYIPHLRLIIYDVILIACKCISTIILCFTLNILCISVFAGRGTEGVTVVQIVTSLGANV